MLTKFFITLAESQVPGMKPLIVTFEYPLNIYKKNLKRYNLLTSQYDMMYTNMGKFWCHEYLDYVEYNRDMLSLLADDYEVLEIMLKSYIDEKGEYIVSNPDEYLIKKASDDMYNNSESPRSYLNLHLGGMGSLGLNGFEDNDKDLLKEMSRYIHSSY